MANTGTSKYRERHLKMNVVEFSFHHFATFLRVGSMDCFRDQLDIKKKKLRKKIFLFTIIKDDTSSTKMRV